MNKSETTLDKIEKKILISSRIFAVAAFILVVISVYLILFISYEKLPDVVQAKKVSSVIYAGIEMLDYYLIAGIFYISGAAFWQLFVDKIEKKQDGDFSGGTDISSITSIDTLKHRLSRLILVILLVKTFEYIIPYLDEGTYTLDQAYIAISLAVVTTLVALSIYLSSAAESERSAIGSKIDPK